MLELDDIDCGCASCAGDPTISAGSMGKPVLGRGRHERREETPVA